jgi:hypothetical protein
MIGTLFRHVKSPINLPEPTVQFNRHNPFCQIIGKTAGIFGIQNFLPYVASIATTP